jgi:DNA polymerase elongation subunit (family B)
VRATGIEEEHGELEVLLDDFIGEFDEFMASEAARRDTSRARDAAIAEGGRQAREMGMRRQSSPAEAELDLESDASGDGEDNDAVESDRATREPVPTGNPSSTPGPGSSGSFANGECVEGEVLWLMQIRNSAWSPELESKEKMTSRRLAFEIESETRRRELEQAKIEVEKMRARTEEEREARLQQKAERDARIEELRIEAQQAQTAMLMKMMEMLHRKES